MSEDDPSPQKVTPPLAVQRPSFDGSIVDAETPQTPLSPVETTASQKLDTPDGTSSVKSEQYDKFPVPVAERLLTYAFDVIENISDALITLNRDWCFTYVNACAEVLLRRSRKELLDKNIWELYPHAGDTPFYRAYHHAMEGVEVEPFEEYSEVLDAWLYVRVTPLQSGICVLLEDVTERVRAERSTTRLASIVEASDDAILSKTLEGIITSWNKAAERMFGYTAEEIVGKPKTTIFPPDRLHEEEVILERLKQGLTTEHFETVRVHKDGTPVHVSVTISPVRDKEGTVTGASTIARNITERKVLQAQLEEAHRLESLGRLAGGIAHDFNNMLTAIIGYTQMAQMHTTAESQTAHYLSNVFDASSRAAALTQQLLMYARRQMVEFTTTDINLVVKNVGSLLRGVIGDFCRLDYSLHKGLWLINANTPQMEQMIINLVTNARDAMPEGGRILVETRNVVIDSRYAALHIGVTPGEYVLLALSDNGVGMNPEIKEHIFEPFSPPKRWAKGRVWDWQPATALSSNAVAIFGSTVNRDSERPSRFTCRAFTLPQ